MITISKPQHRLLYTPNFLFFSPFRGTIYQNPYAKSGCTLPSRWPFVKDAFLVAIEWYPVTNPISLSFQVLTKEQCPLRPLFQAFEPQPKAPARQEHRERSWQQLKFWELGRFFLRIVALFALGLLFQLPPRYTTLVAVLKVTKFAGLKQC